MDPIVVQHESTTSERLMRMMQNGGGGMRYVPRSNPALAVGGVGTLLGGGCVLAAGIVTAVEIPAPYVLSGTTATDLAALNTNIAKLAKGNFVGGILNSIGGGLLIIGGAAEAVAGMLRR